MYTTRTQSIYKLASLYQIVNLKVFTVNLCAMAHGGAILGAPTLNSVRAVPSIQLCHVLSQLPGSPLLLGSLLVPPHSRCIEEGAISVYKIENLS